MLKAIRPFILVFLLAGCGGQIHNSTVPAQQAGAPQVTGQAPGRPPGQPTSQPLLDQTPIRPLACSLTSDFGTYDLARNVTFTGTITGGVAPYTLPGFEPGGQAQIVVKLPATAWSVVSTIVKYSLVGTFTGQLTVRDSAGSQTSCSRQVVVSQAAILDPVFPEPSPIPSQSPSPSASPSASPHPSASPSASPHPSASPSASPQPSASPSSPPQPPPSPPPVTVTAGPFQFGGSYYLAGQGHACRASSLNLWHRLGGTASSPVATAFPSLVLDGDCLLPAGASRIGPTGIIVHGNQYCVADSLEIWQALGGGQSLPGATDYSPLPNSMHSIGECLLPAGYFVFNGGLFASKANGHFCWIISEAQGNLMRTLAPATVYSFPVLPSNEVYDRECWLPQGFYTSSGRYLFANNNGHYVTISNLGLWDVLNPGNKSTELPIPATMVDDGGWPNGFELVNVFQLSGQNGADILESLAPNEGAPWYAPLGLAFQILPYEVPNSVALHRCRSLGGLLRHWMTTDGTCGGQANEGVYGYAFKTPQYGTAALYLDFNPATQTYWVTKQPAQHQALLQSGFVSYGVLGYVF